MNREVEQLMKFQAGGRSMPLQPGDTATIEGLAGVFVVVSFDGSKYTLRSESGAELKAGRKTVESTFFHTKEHNHG